MPYFQTADGCRLYYEAHGLERDRPVVVFLNGTTQTTLHWRPQLLWLKKQFGVILYDARAQGRSQAGSRPLDLELHTADLIALLGQLRISKTHLVGLSHGAHIALAAAGRPDPRVHRLVLCGIGAEPSARMQTIVASWMAVLKTCGLEAMAWAALPTILGETYLHHNRRIRSKIVDAIVRRNRKDYLLAHLAAMPSYPPPASLAVNLTRPTLILAGEQDPMVPVSEVEKLSALCRGTHTVIPRVGHTVPVEAPRRFNRAVSDFLKDAEN